ncbi:D-lactate dehydrogenase [Arboricoccus pini]|uniref:D-lactate dehydrogenase n=1 Tax=Arboricoccus pini TaxID=1963835 RepID=A0A212QQG8_9PROT|nr:2-hydroxyacid dehydrogenase [Arboricoccus pini]SNB61680.1 D-lactate dehydrogenase [Arboricoccus pini]
MRVAVFSAKRYDREFLTEANRAFGHELIFHEVMLEPHTVTLAEGFPAVSVFVNDLVDREVLTGLSAGGTRFIATRSTGFNHIDLAAARDLGLRVARVESYSPYAVAEFAVGLILALNRKIHRAYNRTREGNFELDGLLGFDLRGRRVGVIGTGKIGRVFASIMQGFGCEIVGFDPFPNPAFEALGGHYLTSAELMATSDIVSLHCPLTDATRHIVDAEALAQARPGLLLINTSRGGLVDTLAAIEALKAGRIGGLGIDVYEQEASLFFRDHSSDVIGDDVIQRLVSFPNVIVTGHQAFFTREAIDTICATTLANVRAFEAGEPLLNEVRLS